MIPSSPKEALVAGLRWYISGKPCPAGHIAKRSVSNQECRACVDAKRSMRRRSDPAWTKAKTKRRYWKDVEKSRADGKASADRNREKRRAGNRAHYRANKDAYKNRAKAWGKSHPEYLRHQNALRRARILRASPPWLTKAQKAQMARFYARAQRIGFEVDHIVPLRGKNVCGLHVPWNLQHLSTRRNRQKGNRYEP